MARRSLLLLAVAAVAGQVMAFVPLALPSARTDGRSQLSTAVVSRSSPARIVMGVTRRDQQKRRVTSLLKHVNAPLHKRRTIMSSPLSKELREQYGGVRAIPIRTGDEVIVTAGDHKKKTGKVVGVDRKKFYIHIEGITREKAGAKESGKTSTMIPVPISPNKVRITKLYLDSSREAILKRRQEGRAALAAARKVEVRPASEDPTWQEYQTKLNDILRGSA
uniref:Plastid ribosomal protein L26 n=1 Tax=Vischeria sp. CAUP Q 202 TaxID=1805947 RepID=A0A451FLH8_9STRA|nr:plastid ribosomal protein L26 [Vischeria sp. CAUP Q 202]